MQRTDISAFVAEAAEEVPERQALVESGGRSLTWAQLDDEVGRIATGLGAEGIRAGPAGDARRREPHRVRHRLPRRPACPGRRRTGQPTLGARRDRPHARRLRHPPGAWSTSPRSTSSARRCRARRRAALPDRRRRDRAAGGRDWRSPRCAPTSPDRVPPLPDPEKLAALLYTSGTSGRPRGAMLSHRALLANIEQVASVEPPMMHGDDVVLGLLPLFHVYGLNAVLGGVLRHGARLLLVEQFDPQAAARPDRRRGLHRGPARAAGLRRTGCRTSDLKRAARPGRGWSCPARRRSTRR